MAKPEPVELTLRAEFTCSVERTDRVMAVAEAFGLGLDDRKFVVLDDIKLTVTPGDVIYVTGQSGSGKSVLLREITKGLEAAGQKIALIDNVVFDTKKPIIDQVGKDMADATRLLAMAGISDAYLFLRKPQELSDGQRYRLRLAMLLEQDTDVWVADEFGAVLDRVTAACVALNIQKLARKTGKTVIVATTHTDLIEALGPSKIVRKRFHDRIEIETP